MAVIKAIWHLESKGYLGSPTGLLLLSNIVFDHTWKNVNRLQISHQFVWTIQPKVKHRKKVLWPSSIMNHLYTIQHQGYICVYIFKHTSHFKFFKLYNTRLYIIWIYGKYQRDMESNILWVDEKSRIFYSNLLKNRGWERLQWHVCSNLTLSN